MGSIHPQGWVPVEMHRMTPFVDGHIPEGSIHPQGWVPVEIGDVVRALWWYSVLEVAFTPKGGCPLKYSHKPGDAGRQQLYQ